MKLRKISLIFILTITIFTMTNIKNAFASTATSLVVHYHRYDDTISEYDLWLWTGDLEGSNYAFNGSDSYGAVATINLAGTDLAGVNSIGILLKIGSWEEQDISFDRFINMTNPNILGAVHVYLLQGEEFISYVSSDTPSCDRDVFNDPLECAQVLGIKLIDTYFNDDLNVYFATSISVDAADVTVLKEGVPVSYTGFTSGSNGILDLVDPVDVSKKYELQVDLGTEVVTNIIRVGSDFDSQIFQDAYNYTGELGVQYSSEQTTFKLWAPLSSDVKLNLYDAGHTTSTRSDGDDTPEIHQMSYLEKGVWEVTILGDLHGIYYTYTVTNSGETIEDIQDPYGQSFGLNGLRSMVVDFDSINPAGWNTDSGIDGYTSPNDSIIYELHVRDLTSQLAWGGPLEYAKTYMGLTVTGTTYTNTNNGVTVSTGLDHLVELGITHVHLLPTYDQDWNDERNFLFNWGYNPQNYNSPEGGYSTDPYDGAVRITEYKEMVMALHNNGINIIQDVVYNHTGPGAYYSFNRIVPNYFYRLNTDGTFSNGTGVGNETASERYMVRKFIDDSITMWAEEYHIDGFRFDLMAVHDVTTMNLVASSLELIDPDIFVYGEPWGGGTIALPYNLQAGINNIKNMPYISAFNDRFRDALKGSTWTATDKGYVTDSYGTTDVMKGIQGSVNWDWGLTSTQSINYVSAHDNLTLYDKLKSANNSTGYTKDIDYQARLANSIVMFSQGIPFLHAGVDFLRTKGGDDNSYDASDLVNQLNWVRKSIYVDSFEYYKGIIEIRKNYESFKMTSKSDIEANLTFLYPAGYGMIGYNLTKNSENILIYHNGGQNINDITLPSGAWSLISDRDFAGLDSLGTYTGTYPIEKAETLVFVSGNYVDVIPSPEHEVEVSIPVITSLIGIIYEGGTFNLTSVSTIAAYKIDDGEFINVTPAISVPITGLTEGNYTITMKDTNGAVSVPFSITVLPRTGEIIAPLITNSINTINEGETFILTSDSSISAYKINDGDFIVVTPGVSIPIIGLTEGTYTIVIKDLDDIYSDPFTLTVSPQTVDPEPVYCVDEPNTIGCIEEDPAEPNNTPTIIALVIVGVVGLVAAGILFFKKLVV